MGEYERRLPHWDAVGHPVFVTFRLHGSLPVKRVFPPERQTNAGKAFVAMDRLLDRATSGPLFLGIPEIACMVARAIRAGERQSHRYELHAYVVMPNHVHMLVTPLVNSTCWLGPLKGFTSHEANVFLHRSGAHFWQDESYDHLVRSAEEFDRVRRYIEMNPVKAGLIAVAELFPWSSAGIAG